MNTKAARGGRPRSEAARIAVLNAVDDLLVEVGYSAMSMKTIAKRAGVSRQTVYRWWSSKAEILHEACIDDAAEELSVDVAETPKETLTDYLTALSTFLTSSHAGIAYRALLGEAQHDAAVARLLAQRDPLGDSARVVITEVFGAEALPGSMDQAVALLLGPTLYRILSGRQRSALSPDQLAAGFLALTR